MSDLTDEELIATRIINGSMSKKEIVKYISKLQKENKELKNDMSQMYYKEVIINIIQDEFNLTRNEVLELLGEEE